MVDAHTESWNMWAADQADATRYMMPAVGAEAGEMATHFLEPAKPKF